MRRFSWILLALTACGGGGGGTGPTPHTVVVNAGNNQIGGAGAALPESLAVFVSDQNGDPLTEVDIGFAVTAGGGSVSPTTRRTNASGIAKTRFTLGPNAGTQTVSATAIDFSLTPAQFSAVSQINGAVGIVFQTLGDLTDTVDAINPESLTVLVIDQNTTPVPGIAVTWSSTTGLVSAASVPTNAAGLSKVQFTFGPTAGIQTATATVTGLVGSPLIQTLHAEAGTAVSLAKTVGDNGTAPPSSQVTYTVQSRDRHANPKGGVTIDWSAVTGGGSITPATNVTAANGNASAQRTLGGGSGNQTARAIAAGLSTPDTVTFTTHAEIVTTITVSNNNFTPDSILIPKNTTVTYSWNGTTSLHNVTFANVAGAPADVPNSTSGSAPRTFNTAGTFNYQCTNHAGMTGKVVVTP